MFKDIEFKKIDCNNIYSCVTPSICYAEAIIEDVNGKEYRIAVHSSLPDILFISKSELSSSLSFDDLNKFYKESTQTICNNHLEVYSALYGTIFKELCKSNLNHKFRFAFTENGLKNAQTFIRECNAKRKEVLDAQLDTAEDTSLPTEGDILCDLYCGIGTISLFMAKYAKKVYGIEIVKEAIDAAKKNAKINNVDNTEFYAGDVEVVLDELINKNKVKADIVMFDPPRKGLDKKSINNILQIKPKKLVYISCNPATLIRDLKMFEEQYEIKTIVPVDMFPWTSHIECVSLLCLKKGLS